MYFTYNVFRTNIFDTPWLAICQCYLKLIVRLTRCNANLSYTMGWWVNNGTLTTKLIINYQPFAYLSCNKYPKIQSTILHTLHRVHLGKVIHICYYSSSKISKSDLHCGRDNIFVFFLFIEFFTICQCFVLCLFWHYYPFFLTAIYCFPPWSY